MAVFSLFFLNVQCVGWWSAGDRDWEQDDGVDSIVVCKIGCKIKINMLMYGFTNAMFKTSWASGKVCGKILIEFTLLLS